MVKNSKTNNWKAFQHRKCEFFPCHEGADEETFSCLQCYCPIFWHCGTRIAGMDCSQCMFPHDPKMHDAMQQCIATLYKKHKPLPT